MTATPRTALRGLYDPCRTMEEYVQERMSRADLLTAHADPRPSDIAADADLCETASLLIRALHDKLKAWDCDALQDVVHGLDVLAGDAGAAAVRLQGELPQGSEYE